MLADGSGAAYLVALSSCRFWQIWCGTLGRGVSGALAHFIIVRQQSSRVAESAILGAGNPDRSGLPVADQGRPNPVPHTRTHNAGAVVVRRRGPAYGQWRGCRPTDRPLPAQVHYSR